MATTLRSKRRLENGIAQNSLSILDRFPKVRSFIAEREFLEGKAREGSWSEPMTAEQRCHREILSGI